MYQSRLLSFIILSIYWKVLHLKYGNLNSFILLFGCNCLRYVPRIEPAPTYEPQSQKLRDLAYQKLLETDREEFDQKFSITLENGRKLLQKLRRQEIQEGRIGGSSSMLMGGSNSMLMGGSPRSGNNNIHNRISGISSALYEDNYRESNEFKDLFQKLEAKPAVFQESLANQVNAWDQFLESKLQREQ
jgi:hypothetical protein